MILVRFINITRKGFCRLIICPPFLFIILIKGEGSMEEWKDIIGYEGLYQVSSHGNVRSFDRVMKGKNNTSRLRKGVVFSTKVSGNSYVCVSLTKNNKTSSHNVHKLVATHFIPNEDNLPEINHKDEIKYNNHVDNLEWCTRKYNANYGTSKERIVSHPNHKTMVKNKRKKIRQYDFLGNFIKEWDSVSSAVKDSGCSVDYITDSLHGRYTGLGLYVWEYVK